MNRAPATVPPIVAKPPNRLVPPSTVAAITSSSNMMPAFGEPLPSRAVATMPPSAASSPTPA